MLDRTGTLTWLESNGGPLVLLSRELLPQWHGTGDDLLTDDYTGTDYGRACAVDGYAELIPVGGGQGLVLGDMPMPTTWFSPEAAVHRTPVLVRWMYADDEAAVLRSLEAIPEQIWEPEMLRFVVGSEPLYLFDAAFPGTDVGTDSCPCLVTELPAGTYAVATGLFEPDDRTSLVRHRFMSTRAC